MDKTRRAVILAGAAIAIPAVINLAVARRRRDLVPALAGESSDYDWPLGAIHYNTRGEGDPILLVHGIGAGESNYEWRLNFDALSALGKVFALDMPGFGASERRDISYTADTYVTALIDFIRDVVGGPVTMVASSLSGAYAIKLAATRPDLVSRLVLVAPTGIEQLKNRLPGWTPLVYGAMSLPVVSTAIYNAIASRDNIQRYLIENCYSDPARVTPGMVEHYYQCAHQPGSQYVLRSFLSGVLNCDVTSYFSQLTQPVLLAWGRLSRITPIDRARAFLEANPAAILRVFEESGALPHDEEATAFNRTVEEFLQGRLLPADNQAIQLPNPFEVPALPAGIDL